MIKKTLPIFIVFISLLCSCEFNANLWENTNDIPKCNDGVELTNPVPLKILNTYPNEGESIVSDNNLIIEFSAPIFPGAINDSSIEIFFNNNLASDVIIEEGTEEETAVIVPGSLVVDKNNPFILSFIPDNPFKPGIYDLNINDSIRDIACNKLNGNKNLSFVVDVDDNNIYPEIKKIIPRVSNDEIRIKKTDIIKIVFNKLMKKYKSNGRRQGTVLAVVDGKPVELAQKWIGGKKFTNLFWFQLPEDKNIINIDGESSFLKDMKITITLDEFLSFDGKELIGETTFNLIVK